MTERATRMFSLTRTQRYGIAILGVVSVAVLRLSLDPILGEDLPLFLFTFPIVLACWSGGLWPGLLATALSLLLGDYLFLAPRRSIFLYENTFNAARAVALAFVGSAFSILFHKIREAIKAYLECMERFRLLVENVPDYAIFTLDRHGRVACWNSGAERIEGYREDDVIGRDLSMFYKREDVETGKPQKDLEVAAATGRYEEEGWEMRRDGSLFWASGVIAPLRDARGEFCGFAKITRDMTARKQADEALRENQRFLQHIIDVSPSVIWICDLRQRTTVFVNRGIAGGLSCPPQQDAQKSEFMRPVMHPDDWQPFLDHITQLARLGDEETADFEYRMRDNNGDWRWFHSRDKVFTRNEDGSVRDIIGTATDITERKTTARNIAFTADLNQALPPLGDPEQVISVAARMLAEHMGVDRCTYADVDADEDHFVIVGEYVRGAAPCTLARLRMSEFGGNERQTLRENRPYVVNDLEDEAPAGTNLSLYRRMQTRSLVCVPLKKNGNFVARMSVNQNTPRRWSSEEIKLIRTVANRCWESVERARAIRNLKQSDERYRAFITNSSEGIWRFELEQPIPTALPEDEQIKMLYQFAYVAECNDAMARMYGFDSSDQLLGARIGNLLPRSDPDNIAFLCAFKRAGYRLTDGETREIDRHGNTKYFLNNLTAVQENGAVVRCWGTQRDITDRKQAQEALRESEERLRRITDATQDALWEIDLTTKQLWWSERASPLFGHSPGELQIRLEDWYNAIHPEDVERVRTNFEHFLRDGGADWVDEYRFRRADGCYVDIHDQGRKFFDETGTPVRIAGAMADITTRKRAEEALRESEERFSKAFRASPDGLVISRIADGVIVEVNDSFVALSGRDRDELIGRSTLMLDIYVDPRIRESALKILKEQNCVRDFEFAMKTKSGEVRLISFSADPLDLRGEHCWLTIVRDITERRQAEQERERLLQQEKAAREEAEAASRLKDEFLATLSHELRTPLTSILGWARLLASRALSDSQTRRGLEVIERSARAQARLVDDILDTSRIITGRLMLDARPVRIEQVFQAAIDVIRPGAEAKNIALDVVMDDRGSVVLGDANRLQQVIWNLLSNAVKFTDEGGKVRAQLSRIENHVEITVTDTGVGIEPPFVPHVFDRFRQADSTSKRRFGGLGLGLAIVRHVVEMHGGSVSASSLGKGCGSTFTVRFPLAPEVFLPSESRPPQAVKQPFSPIRSEEMRLDGVRVLVVEDDPDTLEMLKFILGKSGAEVSTAASTGEALSILDRWRPTALVSDVGSRGQGGYELIENVRARPPEQGGNIPAVALSAYARSEDRIRALSAGFQMHVAKPIAPEELVAAVARLMRRIDF